jgi:hypothetical protein
MARLTLVPHPDKRISTRQTGKVGWAIAWLLGVPIPVLLVIYLFTRAC